jgi:glycosyltransferase involved in cell wall biosynthesis
LKVLYVIPSYEPAWAFGGTVTATSQLCRGLANQGVDISVYTTNANGKSGHLAVPLNEPIELGGVKVTYFHCDFRASKAFYSSDLSNKLKETVKDFDIVHVSAIWQFIQVNVYKACKRNNIPYIVTPNGSFRIYPWKQNVLKKRLFWYLFGKQTVKNANAIHFTTEAEREDSFLTVPFLRQIPNFIVPNGIQIHRDISKRDIRKELGISNEKFLVLYLGRIHRIKGIEFLFKALEKLKDSDICFLIVGPEEDKEYIIDLKKLSESLNINKKIIWHDGVSREEVWNYYDCVDLYVLLSYSENFALTVAEAMSCGLPVLISNNVGIQKEVQEDNAGFVVNQNVDEIAVVLKKCTESRDLLKQLSQNARKSVENRYDINKVADLMVKAYEDILTGRRSQELQWR